MTRFGVVPEPAGSVVSADLAPTRPELPPQPQVVAGVTDEAALEERRREALMRQAELRAGAAAYWMLVEARVVAHRPAPVYWDLPPDDQVPCIRLAKAIIERERIAYHAGLSQGRTSEQTVDDLVEERDSAERALEKAEARVEHLEELVQQLEARLGVRAADAAFAAVDETLSHRCDSEDGAIIPDRKAGSE